jgi:hypothetical protein
VQKRRWRDVSMLLKEVGQRNEVFLRWKKKVLGSCRGMERIEIKNIDKIFNYIYHIF